jgi:hypothetical protein
MRSTFLTSVAVAGAVLTAACSDQRSPLPTAPPLSSNFTIPTGCPRPIELARLIGALFAPKDLLAFALQMHSDINLKMSRGDVAGARKVVVAFIDFTVKAYNDGKLRDPIGILPSNTKKAAVIKLIDGLLCWVGLPPSGISLDFPVTAAVIGPGPGDLVATGGYAALRVEAGTVTSPHLWVITRRDDLAQSGTCVTGTELQQIPLCIDFSVVPADPLLHPLTVVVCQVNNPGDRLAHQVGEGFELLPPTTDPFGLPCPHTESPAPRGLGSIGRAVWRFGSFVVRVLGPKPVYAGHIGLGGLVSPKLSNVTAVRIPSP